MIQWSDFFKIVSKAEAHPTFSATIEFNPGHDIFKGHFPGNPVVPGVCMVQVIKLILNDIYQKDFMMKKASQLKFLSVLNPNENKTVLVELTIVKEDTNGLEVSGSIYKGTIVFMKYKAAFVSIMK